MSETMRVNLLPFEDAKMKELMSYYSTEDTVENRTRLFVTLMIEKHEFLTERMKKTSRKNKMTKTLTKTLERQRKLAMALDSNSDWNLNQLSNEVGCTLTTLRNDLREIGREDLITGGHLKRWSSERWIRHKRILELVEQGTWFVDDLASATNVHRRTMYKDLEDLGLEDVLAKSREEMNRKIGENRKTKST